MKNESGSQSCVYEEKFFKYARSYHEPNSSEQLCGYVNKKSTKSMKYEEMEFNSIKNDLILT